MRILVFSDTHGRIDEALFIMKHLETDIIIHLGDVLKDAYDIDALTDARVYYIAGNNDFFSGISTERIVEIEGFKLLLTHSHDYGTKDKKEKLVKRAKEENCDAVLFGHTHKSFNETIDGILVFNPGSTSKPRGDKKSYGVIEIEDGKMKAAVCPI